jgi:hypothetical protein
VKNKIDACLNATHRIELMLRDIQHNVEINTVDLAEHIKRTELLEKKLSKIYTASLIGTGFALAYFGPEITKYIGLFI